jgi:outer membrane receptor for ferrienterochelin and colicins
MSRKSIYTILLILTAVLPKLYGQYTDSLIQGELKEMVITATRTERSLSNLAVPTLVVPGRQIKLSGVLRLNDILQEQTGLFISSGTGSSAVGGGVFGNGVQIQGLSPDYTMIMIDGEPMIGRQGGVLDLSRYTVGNIRKIEIVKGPSSALYGSEAMGGVINIITEQSFEDYFRAGLRYGSFHSTDINLAANKHGKRSSVYAFANFNSGQGYDLNLENPEKTLDPFHNFTGQLKWTYRFNEKTRINWNNRIFYGIQQSAFAINSEEINIAGRGKTIDINVNPTLTHLVNDRLKTILRFYGSVYRFDQYLNDIPNATSYYNDDFLQQFYRLESQTDWDYNEHSTLTFGAGYNLQTVETARYKERKFQHIGYVFVQQEWNLGNQWSIIPGFRYDKNSDYEDRLSPKLAAQYKINNQWNVNFSYGGGFKAPDFRQLYLYYINNAAQGYIIYGASEFSIDELLQQKENGLIERILPDAYRITTLRPEISHGFNIGSNFTPSDVPLKASVNIFYNQIRDLINYVPVALQPNNAFVFSYLNVQKAYTMGIEFNVSGKLNKNIDWNMGYQYLKTADLDIVRKIQNDEVYGRDSEGGSARLMNLDDYSGLLGRSPNMINAGLTYEEPNNGWAATIRAIYRSSWGVTDRDGNGFANMPEEFARGFVLLNISIQKKIGKQYLAQVGLNNVLNHMDALNTPQLPGIQYFISIQYNFFTKNNH